MEMIALESFDGDAQEVAELLNLIQVTGRVSRTQIQPYVQHFPVYVGLANFTEEPSEQSVGIALEGMSVLLKVAIGVALAGVIGAIVLHVVNSRKAAGTTVSNARDVLNQLALVEDLEKAQEILDVSLLTTADGSKLPTEVRKGTGEIAWSETEKVTTQRFQGTVNQNVTGLAMAIAMGEYEPASSSTTTVVEHFLKEATTTLERIERIIRQGSELSSVAVNGGRVVEELYAIIDSPTRRQLLGTLEHSYGRNLGGLQAVTALQNSRHQDSSYRLVDATTKLDAIVGNYTATKVTQKQLDDLAAVAKQNGLDQWALRCKAVATHVVKRDVVNFDRHLSVLASGYERLKRHNNDVTLPQEVGDAVGLALDAVERDLRSVETMIKLYSVEIEAILRLARALAEYVSLDTKVLARYLEHPDVPAEVRHKFNDLVKAALSSYKR